MRTKLNAYESSLPLMIYNFVKDHLKVKTTLKKSGLFNWTSVTYLHLHRQCGFGACVATLGAEESPSGRKKRKRQGDHMEERLISALESGTQNLQLQWVLDRELRKEQGKLFLSVLDQLVHAIGRMADAMEEHKG